MAGHRYHAFANVPPHDLAPLPRARLVGRPWMWVARKLFREMEREQLRWAIQSFLDGAVVGSGCRLTGRAWCVNSGPKANIRIGDHVICRGLVRSEDFHPGEIIIGDEVYLGDDTILSSAERIKIGRGTMLAHGVHVFDNDSHPLHADLRERDRRIAVGIESGPRDDIVSAPIEIGEDAWIGFNSIILKGVRIGRGSVIAAGSVVTADVPPDTIVAGNPARVVREIGTSAVLES